MRKLTLIGAIRPARADDPSNREDTGMQHETRRSCPFPRRQGCRSECDSQGRHASKFRSSRQAHACVYRIHVQARIYEAFARKLAAATEKVEGHIADALAGRANDTIFGTSIAKPATDHLSHIQETLQCQREYGPDLCRGGALRWSQIQGLDREGPRHWIEDYLGLKYISRSA
ncbi:MAG: hypothetical protein QM682_12345 [Paracoccus sp. (in: a-proteobacteria)]|uniref:hypothetical protein n=1 Tax=Paracoccus sp. TaxID=267 RepID=UPI0039E294CE